MSHTHLWLDTVAGLEKQGWIKKGGNFTSFMILEKEGERIKVYLKYHNKLNQEDTNSVIVRHL